MVVEALVQDFTKVTNKPKVRFVMIVLQAFDEEHDVNEFQPMHERQKMERTGPGFLAQ